MKIKLLLLPIMFFLFSVQVFSEGSALDRVVDNAGLLSASEKNDLAGLMDHVASVYHFDLVIVTETDIGNTSPAQYAADFFDNNGYSQDGCLFLRVMGTRDYCLSASGRGNKILNSYAFSKLESNTVKFFDEDNYSAAFNAFTQEWEKYLILEAKGRSYNFFYQWNIVLTIIAWLSAMGIGCVIVFIWKRGMNTAMPQTQAAAYVVSGSLNFTSKKDRLLFSHVSKIKKSSGGSSSSLSGLSKTLSSSGKSHSSRSGRR